MVLASTCLADDFAELQAAIEAKGAKWTASDTPLWRNRLEMMRKATLIPGGPAPPENVYIPESPKDLPTHFDWRDVDGVDWMTPVKDQGNCGGCGSFGALGAFEPILKYKHNNPEWDVDLSEAHLFFCAGGTCAGGILMGEIAIYLKEWGVPDEECFPYTAGMTGEDQSCLETCEDWLERAYSADDWMWVNFPPGDAEPPEVVKQAIYEKGPLYAAIQLCEDFYAYEGGVYEYTWGNCSSTATHGVTILGWDDAEQYWIGKNFWKKSQIEWWGEDGYFRIKWGQLQVENWLIAFEYEADVPIDDDTDDDDASDDDSSDREDESDSDGAGCGC